jgi:ADP-ribose pyrophosphatase
MSYQLIEKQVIYTGKIITLEIHHLENDQGRRRHREIVVHPGAAVVIPFLDPRTILLIRNHRYAVRQILLELPAGTLDKNEDPMNCAGRELQEETGYLAGKLKILGNFFTSPGVLTEKIYAFAAYDLQKSRTNLQEGEEIEVLPTNLNEAIRMVRDGEIIDAKSIAVLLTYELFHRGMK